VNLSLYEQGLEDGIEKGQLILLLELLKKKLGNISDNYLYELELLEGSTILNIASNIFEIRDYNDLDKYIK
jgi:hypothetical protein